MQPKYIDITLFNCTNIKCHMKIAYQSFTKQMQTNAFTK